MVGEEEHVLVHEEEEAVHEVEVPAQKEKAAAPVLPAPPPALRGQSKCVSCQLCGRENIDKKSIRKHERSTNCMENRRGTATAQLPAPAPASKRGAPAAISPETSKRQCLPTPSSSTPPSRRTRKRNVN